MSLCRSPHSCLRRSDGGSIPFNRTLLIIGLLLGERAGQTSQLPWQGAQLESAQLGPPGSPMYPSTRASVSGIESSAMRALAL